MYLESTVCSSDLSDGAPRTANLTAAQATAAAAIKRYRDRFEELNTRHQSLARAEHDAWDRYRKLDDLPLSRIEPVRHAVLLDRSRWQNLISLMAAMAGMLGLGMAWLAKRGSRAFYSAEQVSRELELPVVGTLASQKFSPGRLAYSLQRGIRTACEGLVAVIAIWLVMLAVLDHAFLDQMTSDPLAAVALAWQR